MLAVKDILTQLEQLGLSQSVVIDCLRVGNNPNMDWVMQRDQDRLSFKAFGGFHLLIEGAKDALSANHEAQLVMLCDLYAECNEPKPGVQWSGEQRVKGALAGLMSCLLVLTRGQSSLGKLLFEKPGRLVIATIEDGKIVPQVGHGEKMIEFLANSTLFPG